MKPETSDRILDAILLITGIVCMIFIVVSLLGVVGCVCNTGVCTIGERQNVKASTTHAPDKQLDVDIPVGKKR